MIEVRCACGRKLFEVSEDASGKIEIICVKCGAKITLTLGRVIQLALVKLN